MNLLSFIYTRELFKLPPYVLYVSRAFSTLEGIGLSIDEDYSILQECYPYLAKRLFSDDSPRAQNALRLMLFGKGAGANGGIFSPEKLLEMTEGFASYTAATADADRDGAGSEQAQKALTDLILAPEGNYVQDLLLEEAAKVVDAAVREGVHRARASRGGQLVTAALKAQRDIARAVVPRPLRPLVMGATLPYELLHAAGKLAEKSPEDEASLRTAEAVWKVVQPRISSSNGGTGSSSDSNSGGSGRSLPQVGSSARQFVSQLSNPAVRQQLPALSTLSRRFGATLLNRAAQRLTASTSQSDDNVSLTGRKRRTADDAQTPSSSSSSSSALSSSSLLLPPSSQSKSNSVLVNSSSSGSSISSDGIVRESITLRSPAGGGFSSISGSVSGSSESSIKRPNRSLAGAIQERAAAAGPGVESEVTEALVEGLAVVTAAAARSIAKAIAPP
jgi:hypothetical protein